MKKIIDCFTYKSIFLILSLISLTVYVYSFTNLEDYVKVFFKIFLIGLNKNSLVISLIFFSIVIISLFIEKRKNLFQKVNTYLTVSLIISVPFIISVIFQWYRLKDWPERGTFGDSFGAINALFAFLTFIGLIYTINKEKDYFIEQKRTEHFFKLLDIFIELPIRNTDFFRTFTNNIKNNYSKSKTIDIKKEIEILSKNAINSDILYGGNNNISFVVYMNTIESLISYIDKKTDEEELKKDFYKTLQSQFLENEAFFLVIYSLVYEKDSIKRLFKEALEDINNLYYKYFENNNLLEIIESIKK